MAETFTISPEQAELYETKFVPAIFADWAPHLVAAAGVSPGQRVLDVACGTGVAARAAADLGATVVGLDLNEAMLTVARRLRPDIEWRQGDAAELPFADNSFDTVLCQSALMFFPDPAAALREMARVSTPEGTVAVQVYSSLSAQPGYGPFVEVAARHAGPDAVNLLSTYWVHGDVAELTSLFKSSGLDVTAIRTRLGTARFGSVEELVRIEVEGTPLIDRISDETYRRIRADADEALGQFRTGTGVEVPIEGHLVTATSSSR